MGKNDIYMKRWLSDKKRFADLMNGFLFGGKQVFSPQNLRFENKEQEIVLREPDGTEVAIHRYRDITMVSDDGARIVILACENQEEIHYAMPVRGMLYDALSYAEQVRQIKKGRKEKKKLKGNAEFLSGLMKEDRLFPVVTVVFYYGGESEWDGQTELHGLLGIDRKEYKLLKKYVPNYKINLIDLKKLSDISCFQTDLQIILGMLKYRKNKTDLQNYIYSNKDYFSNIDEDSYNAARVLLGSENVLKGEKQESGGIDMCKALDDWYQDGVNEGIEQGREQGIRALMQVLQKEGFDRAKILNELQEGFSLNYEEAKAYFNKFQ